MKLSEALRVLNAAAASAGPPVQFGLACGFEPLHLRTFLAAFLQQRVPDRRVDMTTGLYGDLVGTLEQMATADLEAAAVVLEWQDFDPRLGIRSAGGWRPEDVADMTARAEAQARTLASAITALAHRTPVGVVLPTLALPPVDHAPGFVLGDAGAKLRALAAALAAELAGLARVRVLDPQRLDRRSAPADRLDVKAMLASGFPYRMAHAAAVAELVADVLRPPAPKKGIITDLDDVVWRGILGEEGLGNVHWDLDHHAHGHGLYQQLLNSLAATGVLVAIASKADPEVVEQGLRAPGLLLARDAVFPIEASWGAKSDAVARILAAWNVGAESVVFVDDSPAELAEVQAIFPALECVRFPTADDEALYAMLERLRDLCGKERLSEEDRLRLASLRSGAATASAHGEGGARVDAFLASAGQRLTCLPVAGDPRPLELVNKTNQFNLNGSRWSERDWQRLIARDDAVALCFSYQDRYGPLGKIAVVAGRRAGATLHVDAWVLSCRAFSRRIEYATLAYLFEHLALDEIVLDYRETQRNHLVRDFLAGIVDGAPSGVTAVPRARFDARCPALFFEVAQAAA